MSPSETQVYEFYLCTLVLCKTELFQQVFLDDRYKRNILKIAMETCEEHIENTKIQKY
jgi:hypothetical protein